MILGISLETTTSARDHEHAHEGAHAHHHTRPPDLSFLHDQVRSFVQQLRIGYPVLMDVQGSVAQRYAAENLPTTVLIDVQGFVRRRFLGTRSTETLEDMVRQVQPRMN